jgi:hypothetical protein
MRPVNYGRTDMSSFKYKAGYAIGFAATVAPTVVIAFGAYKLGKSNGRIETLSIVRNVLKEEIAKFEAQKN